MKYIHFLNFLFIFLLCINCKGDAQIPKSNVKIENKKPTISAEKISSLQNFIKNKIYNQELAIFIDFKIPSNKFRFFLYDLKNEKILEKGLVAHGSGSEIPGSAELQFSNIENSLQSSLGKYEISSSYVGSFGKSYRLKGLDKTNDLAMKRAIVMHPLSCMQDVEQKYPSCLSWGCPMLSQNFFDKIAKYIDASKKPIILYCYY
ncbi:murein L,D-transpeptidase catalytic domain-containing protein [Frigoriflavimonas asaccharolytica]|uniref:L,D-transpeptidase-like protein n=1 Tax=Frigoriflavimonas asaccharolytica TaxID=2735899 RepID=A0A8J8G577_9FLAO|nr:murein L,D-transpeptidase catalytic domain family protein [Frigoriflavimonas asaccharolytica]NRS91496.1 hypothetical protein [Frigoriflavimonas asaccharolytica]